MNPETVELLRELATQLGTTSEYLWRVMVHQAPISAIGTLIQMILVGVATYILIKVHLRLSNREDNKNYEDSFGLGIVMIAAAVILGILIIACFFGIEDVINGFFNPEYWALDKILHKIGK